MNQRMFFETVGEPFDSLEREWKTVQAELRNLDFARFQEWPEKFLYESGWHVFGLWAFGRQLTLNCQLCPKTSEIVEQIPGMVTSGFSRLAPRAHIKPHRGYTSRVLRCHLGLIVPKSGSCELRVGDERRAWQEGKCLFFDDTTEHEAWNHSDEERIILLIDIKRDPMDSEIEMPRHLEAKLR